MMSDFDGVLLVLGLLLVLPLIRVVLWDHEGCIVRKMCSHWEYAAFRIDTDVCVSLYLS